VDTPPRQLILSLFGLYARSEGNWLSVRALIALMAELGVDSAAVRSSVSRLKKRGVLESERRDGQAGYALAPSTVELLEAGDTRIWSRPRATPEDGWLVVVFSVPESERARRHALRSLLTRLGFGAASSGVWIAPGTIFDETLAALERAGLAAYTEFFRGDYLGVGDVAERIGQWWDLASLERLYAEFCEEYRGVAPGGRVARNENPGGRVARNENPGGRVARNESIETPPTACEGRGLDTPPLVPRGGYSTTGEAAFATYVPMLTAWRRLPYLDPGLPLAYLPQDWPGIEAAQLFTELDAHLREPAAEYARSIVGEVASAG